ncbi:SDR family NAD(P)-dependent oxidoreductase [Paraburkholderia sp. SIMBA_030]|uniref:SDR family NAD(P)-dependent oxidoreductase n=1 Tax=Paraburkholderia sp. SIMBA_030 TaxID=3085773 RepID=UPI00397CF905
MFRNETRTVDPKNVCSCCDVRFFVRSLCRWIIKLPAVAKPCWVNSKSIRDCRARSIIFGVSSVLADRHESAVRRAAGELATQGHKTLAVRRDVCDDAQVEAMIEQTVSTFGRLDVAYINADVQNVPAKTANSPREYYDRVMAINLRGVWICMKFELPQMRKQGSGAIVNCSSLGGLLGCAAKP